MSERDGFGCAGAIIYMVVQAIAFVLAIYFTVQWATGIAFWIKVCVFLVLETIFGMAAQLVFLAIMAAGLALFDRQ